MLVLRRGENRSTRKKNLSEQGREPTTNSAHICHRDLESNPGHNGGRRALSPLRHPCSPVMRVFPRLAPVACFPALGTPPVAYFPALGTGCMLSSAWHRLHARFSALSTGCMRGCPHLAPVACFPAFGNGCKVFHAWHGVRLSQKRHWFLF